MLVPIYARLRNVAPSWTPASETLTAWYKPGDYVTTPSISWASAIGGTALTNTGVVSPVAVNGCPDFETTTDYPLGVALDWNTIAPDPSHTLFAVIVLESVFRNSATPYSNDGLITDSGSYCGLYLRNNAGTITLYFYEWDTAARVASIDVTSLVGVGGTGFFIAMGKKEGGVLYARAANASTTTGWVAGDACGNLNSSAAFLRVGNASSSTADGIMKSVGVSSTAWSSATAASFETWARSYQ